MVKIDDSLRDNGQAATRTLAAGGLAAGLLAMSCCILPLVLVTLGAGGAWLAQLTALSPYQPVFLSLAALSIGAGFWRAYRKSATCEQGSVCEKPITGKLTKSALWIGAVMAVAAFGVTALGPLMT